MRKLLFPIMLIALTAVTVKDGLANTCLNPGMQISREFGYKPFLHRQAVDGSVLDVRGSSWLSRNGRNSYPIDIRGGADVCLLGGLVRNTNPLRIRWGDLYRRGNAAAVIFGDSPMPRFTVEGIRIAGAWDGIRPRANAPDFTVRGVWLSGVRDDCIENDNLNSGVIEDSLFDGCYVFLSASTKDRKNGSGEVVEVRDNLIRLQPFYWAHYEGPRFQPGHKGLFKWMSFFDGTRSKSPKLKIINNIFLVEQPGNLPAAAMGIPHGKLAECNNNIIVWLGRGDYPAKLPDCFTIVRDISVWNEARSTWLSNHPGVARLPAER